MHFKLKWILFISVILLTAFFLRNSFFRQGFARNQELKHLIGKNFDSLAIIDTNNRLVNIDFANQDYTIVDFWFSECPPCLKEMKKFDHLLQARKENFKIVSISINSYHHWRDLFDSRKELYSFLKASNRSWHHFALKSHEDIRLRNGIPGDNYKLMTERYRTTTYPLYFIVNRKGEIIEAPTSAVDYIETAL